MKGRLPDGPLNDPKRSLILNAHHLNGTRERRISWKINYTRPFSLFTLFLFLCPAHSPLPFFHFSNFCFLFAPWRNGGAAWRPLSCPLALNTTTTAPVPVRSTIVGGKRGASDGGKTFFCCNSKSISSSGGGGGNVRYMPAFIYNVPRLQMRLPFTFHFIFIVQMFYTFTSKLNINCDALVVRRSFGYEMGCLSPLIGAKNA